MPVVARIFRGVARCVIYNCKPYSSCSWISQHHATLSKKQVVVCTRQIGQYFKTSQNYGCVKCLVYIMPRTPEQHEGFPAGTHRIAAPVHPRACQADLEKTISSHCQELKNDLSVVHPVAPSLYQLSYPGYCKFKYAFKILTLADFHPC